MPIRSEPAKLTSSEKLALAVKSIRGKRPDRGRADLRQSAFHARPDLHPPSVTPKDAKLALDAAPQLSAAAAWATENAIYSAYAEGLIFLGYPYLASLTQRPEYRLIIETIAGEMTREWVELKSVAEDDKTDKIRKINDEMKRLKVREVFRAAAIGDGSFGRGHIFIDTGDTDNSEELAMPIGDGRNELSRQKVEKGGLKGLLNLEAMWAYPLTYNATNPLKADWYRPEKWLAMGNTVHRTRLLTVIGRPVPDLLKPSYSFGGISLSQLVKPYVENWLRTRQSVSDLIHSFSILALKTNLDTSLSPESAGPDLENRADLFTLYRDNKGLLLLDKEKEDLVNISIPLSTLDELQAQAQEHMASISHIPLVILLGLSPHGLNATAEPEIRAFYAWVKAFQALLFGDALDTVLGFIQLSLFGEVDPDIVYEWKDLWQLDAAGKAAIQKTKADTRAVDLDSGTIIPEEARKAAAADPDSQYAGLDLDKHPLPPPPTPSPEELLAGGGQGGGAAAAGGVPAANANKPPGAPAAPAAPKPSMRDFSSGVTNRAASAGAGLGDIAFDETAISVHVYLQEIEEEAPGN